METEEVKNIDAAQMDIFQQMLDAGVHLGHSKSKGHPNMKPYILMNRQNIQIINVEKTFEKMQEAGKFLGEVIARGGVVLFVATKIPAKHLMKKMAISLDMPYVSERWLGGTLTNFPIISKRLTYFLEQEAKKTKGELEKYSKKEQMMFKQELSILEKKMGGIKNMKKIPDALFLVDIADHAAAVAEARLLNIPSVALSDTNTNPSLVTHPIPANDKSTLSLEFIFNYLMPILKKSKEKQQTIKETQSTTIPKIKKEK